MQYIIELIDSITIIIFYNFFFTPFRILNIIRILYLYSYNNHYLNFTSVLLKHFFSYI